MSDLLERGSMFLQSQRHLHMTRTVEYRSGPLEIKLQATIGRTEFEQASESGLIHRTESRDYLVRAGDLRGDSGPVLPKGGDTIREILGEGEAARIHIYEVNVPGGVAGQPPWRYSDALHQALRIHTKFIGTEEIPHP